MKKGTVLLCCVLILTLAVGIVNVSAAKETEYGLYLTSLKPTENKGYNGGANAVNITGTIVVDSEDKRTFPNSIEAHHQGGEEHEPSIVKYDISEYSKYKYFTSYIGKNSIIESRGMRASFMVYADDTLIFETFADEEPFHMTVGDEPYLVIVEIPEGTKTLTLRTGDGEDGGDYDTSTWGTPMLVNLNLSSIEITAPAKKEYKVGETLSLIGGLCKVTYNDSIVQELPLSADMVTGFDTSKAGENKLKIAYQGTEIEYTINVTEEKPTEAPATKVPEQKSTPKATATKTAIQSGEKTSEDSNIGMIAVICAAAIIVIAVVVIVIIMKKKK